MKIPINPYPMLGCVECVPANRFVRRGNKLNNGGRVRERPPQGWEVIFGATLVGTYKSLREAKRAAEARYAIAGWCDEKFDSQVEKSIARPAKTKARVWDVYWHDRYGGHDRLPAGFRDHWTDANAFAYGATEADARAYHVASNERNATHGGYRFGVRPHDLSGTMHNLDAFTLALVTMPDEAGVRHTLADLFDEHGLADKAEALRAMPGVVKVCAVGKGDERRGLVTWESYDFVPLGEIAADKLPACLACKTHQSVMWLSTNYMPHHWSCWSCCRVELQRRYVEQRDRERAERIREATNPCAEVST